MLYPRSLISTLLLLPLKLPESLVEEQTKAKFEAMLSDFKDQVRYTSVIRT